MSANVYQVGDKIRLSAEFTNIDGDAEDPGGVEFKIKVPGGTITAYTYGPDLELIKDSVGNYHVDWLIQASGRYRYRFAGTTSGQAADEKEFRAQNSQFD